MSNTINFDERKKARDAKKARKAVAEQRATEAEETWVAEVQEVLGALRAEETDSETLVNLLMRMMGRVSPKAALSQVLEGIHDGTIDPIEVLRAAPHSAAVAAQCYLTKTQDADKDSFYGGREYGVKRAMLEGAVAANDGKLLIAASELPTMTEIFTEAVADREKGEVSRAAQEFGLAVAKLIDARIATVLTENGHKPINMSANADVVAAHARLLRAIEAYCDPELDKGEFGATD